MKKILFLFVCSVLVCDIAHSAYEKCVPSNMAVMASKPCSVEIPALNSTEWSGTCAGAPVSGVAVCVSELTGTQNSFGGYPNAVFSSTAANNKICACKLTSPAVSYYAASTAAVLSAVASVVGGTINTASSCLQRCAGVCAAAMSSSVVVAGGFRTAMFNSSLSQ